MALSSALKLVLVLFTVALATSVEANRGWGWSWGWGANQTEPGSGWGWGSNQTGPSWGWPWGRGSKSNQTDNWGNWGWSQNGGGNGGGGGGSDDHSGAWGWGWSQNGRGESGGSSSNDQTGWWGPHKQPNAEGPRKIIVGGSTGWQYGFDYADWAAKNAPFYVNDVLVFKYNPPAPFTHSVYMFPDLRSYQNCDLKRAKIIGDTTQGAGDGLEFVLKKWQTYYFACGEQNGDHCSKGTMKFSITPVIRQY